MIERVIENWLTRVNERSLEIPFCQLLTSEGYQVVHLSRHGSFEQGKDILAIDPEGVPCAFQLKGSGEKITQRLWAKEYVEQIIRLVELPIKHPSIDSSLPRNVFFVTNGELDEEVRIEIEDRNHEWERRGYPRLNTIVKGQLLARFLDLHTNLWPLELAFERNFLELFLTNGRANLDKRKLADFIINLLPFADENLNRVECSRRLASVAVMTSYVLSAYEKTQNHVAIFEGWVIYTASLIALTEKFRLDASYWRDSLSISCIAIEHALFNLCQELQQRTHLVEGDPLVDHPFYQGRVTWLLGLVSTYFLWKLLRKEPIPDETVTWMKEFSKTHQRDLFLWGEASVPHFVALFWFLLNQTGLPNHIGLLTSVFGKYC